jgi:hypothetical protein
MWKFFCPSNIDRLKRSRLRLPSKLHLLASAMLILGLPILRFPMVAQAQDAAIFENVTLSPGFSPDPTEIRGIGGGSVAAKDVAEQSDTPTGSCVGYMDAQPDHTLNLKAFFSYLNVQIQSKSDTTIVVRGPGGTWCNDDAQEKDAGISGEWLPGTYQVWVGSYGKDQTVPYTIRITQTR